MNISIGKRRSVFDIIIYAKESMIIGKSCCKPKINFIVPPLGRMNTNAKCRGGLRGGSVVRSAIECQHGVSEGLAQLLQGEHR